MGQTYHQPPARESREPGEAEHWAISTVGQEGKASNNVLDRHFGVKLEVQSII